jgi:hypothetical protein
MTALVNIVAENPERGVFFPNREGWAWTTQG